MKFRIKKQKAKEKDFKPVEVPTSSVIVDLQSIGGIQLNSPILEHDILETPLYKLNITYPTNPPYAYVNLFYDKKEREMLYRIIEPPLSVRELKQINKIKEILTDVLAVDYKELTEDKLKDYIRRETNKVIKKYRMRMSRASFEKIVYYTTRNFVGYDRIDPIYHDPNIEDIGCNGVGIPMYCFHRHFENLKTNIVWKTPLELDSFVIKLAQRCGRHVSIAEPLLDGALPDGSRVQITLGGEVTAHGSTFTIRKFREDPFTPIDLINYGTSNTAMLALTWFLIEKGVSILVSGGTASGKTTTLNALSLFMRPEVKVVTIEDTQELNLSHENWIPAITRSGFGPMSSSGKRMGEVDMFDLLKAALRQRPDYIIVGEVRGAEAYTLFQAIATGHAAMGTIHADSPQGVVHRLESDPINVPRIMIKNLDIIVIQARVRVKERIARRITSLVEVVDIDPSTKEVITNTVYEWNAFEDVFRYTGRSYLLEKLEKEKGISMSDILEEIATRKKILMWMKENKIRHYEDVSNIVAEYYKDPDAVIEKIGV